MRPRTSSGCSNASNRAPTANRVATAPPTTTSGISRMNANCRALVIMALPGRSVDPEAPAEAVFVGMEVVQAVLGVLPAVVAGAVVEVHQPQALDLQAHAREGLRPRADDLVGFVALARVACAAAAHGRKRGHAAVGVLGQTPYLGHQRRRFVVREEPLGNVRFHE